MEDVTKQIEQMLDEENPGKMVRCMACGNLLPPVDSEAGHKIGIWYSLALNNVAWVCPDCKRFLDSQIKPGIAFRLALKKRYERRLSKDEAE